MNLIPIPLKSSKLFAMLALTMLAGMSSSITYAVELKFNFTGIESVPLNDVVVSLHSKSTANNTIARATHVEQIERQFSPRVISVQRGTEVSFPNQDDVQHHVYSFSPAKPFELKLFHGKESEAITFDKSGIVVLGCNIHDGMIGYVNVVDTPWFDTSIEGTASIANIPAGEYVMRTWHPNMDSSVIEKTIRVVSDRTFSVSLNIDNLQQEYSYGSSYGSHSSYDDY